MPWVVLSVSPACPSAKSVSVVLNLSHLAIPPRFSWSVTRNRWLHRFYLLVRFGVALTWCWRHREAAVVSPTFMLSQRLGCMNVCLTNLVYARRDRFWRQRRRLPRWIWAQPAAGVWLMAPERSEFGPPVCSPCRWGCVRRQPGEPRRVIEGGEARAAAWPLGAACVSPRCSLDAVPSPAAPCRRYDIEFLAESSTRAAWRRPALPSLHATAVARL